MKHNFTVRQGALDGVEAFLQVAEHRSFRRASADLNVSPSAVSQAIRSLEARIGAALFLRTTRSVGLTEAGERFFARAKPAFEELVGASQVAKELGRRPSGLLRLAVPPGVLPILLESFIASFCRDFPEVEVELSVSSELIDAAAKGFDAGVRLGQFIAADMVTLRLTQSISLVTVASPAYLRLHNAPQRIKDLADHACLRMRRSNGAIAPWSFLVGNKVVDAVVGGPLIANDYVALLWAAVDAMGLAHLPEGIAQDALASGTVVRVLKQFEPSIPGLFLYYPSRNQMMPKLRAFVDHVKRQSKVKRKAD